MKPSSSILIAGGGIFGVTAALELRRRGHAVHLFDPGPLPHPRAASTDISKVIRMDYGPDDFYFELMAEAFGGWDAWNERWKRPLYHQTGMIFITSQPMQPGGFEYESFVRLQQRRVPVERLDGSAIVRRFPAWSTGRYVDGYFNPRAGWAESGAVVEQLAAEARAAGVQIHEGEACAQLLAVGERVQGILTENGSQYEGDAVIIAAGPWTAGLLPGLTGILWPNGQFVYHFAPPDLAAYQPPHFPVWGADIHTSGWYGFPAAQGVVKIANHGPGWRVDPRDQSEVPAEAEESFRAFLRGALPGLANASAERSRLCFYCDTFDGNFLIDYVPDRAGLMICAGGSGHGFKFAPVLGSITADVLERKPNRFAPRFAWRQPEKKVTGQIVTRK